MSTNNKVFQVLVTKGNLAPLAAGSALDALVPGQIGVFDKATNLAIDGTVPVKAFYIGLGVGTGATLADVYFSAGQEVQVDNIRNYTFRAHTPGRPQIVEISDFTANCDTDYALKIEARNMAVYAVNGFTAMSKTYAVRTECCVGCEPCPSGSKADLAVKIVKAVNADPNAYATAQLVDAADAVVTDLDAYRDDPANKDLAVKVRLTSKTITNDVGGNIDHPFSTQTGTALLVSLVAGFECTGKITVTQEGRSVEGDGAFIHSKEYFAGGWNGRPGVYRVGASVESIYKNFTYLSDPAATYDQINLIYDQFSTAGWGEYLNNLNTLVAVPTADATTRNGLVGILDKLVETVGLAPLATVSAAAIANPATQDPAQGGVSNSPA